MREEELFKSEYTCVREIVRAARSVRKQRSQVDPGHIPFQGYLLGIEKDLLGLANQVQLYADRESGS
jgi:hypothetical protein